MKNALISPNESVSYISGWTLPKLEPIYTVIPNAERVAEVADATFEVAPPLFWTACQDDVVANQYYYDSVTKLIEQIPLPPPYPPVPQPQTTGSETI